MGSDFSSMASEDTDDKRKTFKKVSHKICFMGDGGVGSTSVITRFINNHFSNDYDPTIEDQFRKQVVVDDTCVIFEITDTAGQEEFYSLRDQWMSGCDGFVLVYSVERQSSLEAVSKTVQEIQRAKFNLRKEEIPLILCENKIDLQREVPFEDGPKVAKELGMEFARTSAKTREGIDELFQTVHKTMSKKKK